MIEFKGKKVAILGMGESGISASRLLRGLGASVLLSEKKNKEDIREKTEIPEGVETEYGGHSRKIIDAEIIIVSPGVMSNIPILKEAKEKGIPVIGEIELAFYYIPVPIIAITGTNGKTTTTTLIGKIFEEDGRKVIVGGNIGKPLCSFINTDGSFRGVDVVVAEVSSFQLETIKEFRPKVAVILNISENHLDRYATLREYVEAKERILQNQKIEDFAVLSMDSKLVSSLSKKTRARVILFTRKCEPKEGVFVRDGRIISKIAGKENLICDISDIMLVGEHNLENVLAAVASTSIFNIRLESILKVLKEFSGLEHRFEFVREINKVKFINDSKATNIDAVLRALESINSPVILIAGGRYKGGDFGMLGKLMSERLKYIILVGEAKDIIKKSLTKHNLLLASKIKEAGSIKEAVKIAYQLAIAGDCVLLSPGCSSFDMFRDYRERGRIFKEEVENLQ